MPPPSRRNLMDKRASPPTLPPHSRVLCFHTLTHRPICKSFFLITIQQWGGGYPLPLIQRSLIFPLFWLSTLERSTFHRFGHCDFSLAPDPAEPFQPWLAPERTPPR